MDLFNPWYLLMALISSCIGTGAFMYGKRLADGKALVVGFLLIGSSYFVTDPLALLGATVVLTALLFSQQLVAWWEGPRKPRVVAVVPTGRARIR